jgi:hypothetical protein
MRGFIRACLNREGGVAFAVLGEYSWSARGRLLDRGCRQVPDLVKGSRQCFSSEPARLSRAGSLGRATYSVAAQVEPVRCWMG